MNAVVSVIGKDMVGNFAMVMLIDISGINCELDQLQQNLEERVPDMTIHVMHEDIFNSMHRI